MAPPWAESANWIWFKFSPAFQINRVLPKVLGCSPRDGLLVDMDDILFQARWGDATLQVECAITVSCVGWWWGVCHRNRGSVPKFTRNSVAHHTCQSVPSEKVYWGTWKVDNRSGCEQIGQTSRPGEKLVNPNKALTWTWKPKLFPRHFLDQIF